MAISFLNAGPATVMAQPADLPYALVTIGAWEFSGLPSGYTADQMLFNGDLWSTVVYLDGEYVQDLNNWTEDEGSGENATKLTYGVPFEGNTITATRNRLLDRAVNAVAVSTDTTLTLPAANPGRMRDLYVRITASASSAVTWTVARGETWDDMGEPPSSFAANTTSLYHITEVASGVFHCEDMMSGLTRMQMYEMLSVTPSSGTLFLEPYTVATYTAGSSAAAFTVAVVTGVTGRARDCELVIDCTATGAPTVTWPSNFHPRTDAGTDFACEAGVRNVYYISEYATGEFVVGGWQGTAGGNE